MNEYRITKYNPENRTNGIYTVHEWTSIHDVGKTFHDGTFSFSENKKVEKAYVDCCIELIQTANILELSVCCPECYDDKVCLPPQLSEESDIRRVVMCCLQERCWAKLESECFYIHFGYDYHMYVGTDIPYLMAEKIARRYNLYCEVFSSPYR